MNSRRVDCLVLLLFGFFGLLYAEPASAASKFEPPDGQVITGVDADQRGGDTVDGSKAKWDEWTALMGGKPAGISHTFEGFDTWFGFDLDIAKARNATPMITWQTSSTQPDTIAAAGATSTGKRTDQVLLQNAKLGADYGKPVFLRVDQEMNAPWFPWGPYDDAGQLKKEADGSVKFTPADFRQMWKRMEIVFRGGYVRDINAALAAEGLPPLDPQVDYAGIGWMGLPSTSNPDSYFKPADNVAFVWTPLDRPGQPDVAGNRWADYYPGDAHVDWVGQTTYNTVWNSGTMDQRFAWLDAFYQEYSVGHGKPYMMGEWGLDPSPGYGAADNPAYVDRMLEWTKSHPKAKALVYFSVLQSNGTDFRLQSYPESAKALSAGLKAERFLGDLTTIDGGPSYTTESRDASFSFSSPEAASGYKFECSLDGSPFATCSSPAQYPGLADGLHVFKVRTVDSTGVAGEPAVRSWNVDATAPTATAPAEDLASPSQLGATVIPTKISWSGSDSGGSVAGYELQHSAAGGPWTSVTLSDPRATSATLNLEPGTAGTAHRFQVRAKDAAGNWSAWTPGASFTLRAHQETSGNVTYPAGTWTSQALTGSYGGSVKYSAPTAAGSRARFAFGGNEVAWVSTKAGNRGRAEVWVDGVKQTTVDLYAPTGQTRQVVFRKVLPSGSHTLEVRPTGTKNASSSGTRVDVDAFLNVY